MTTTTGTTSAAIDTWKSMEGFFNLTCGVEGIPCDGTESRVMAVRTAGHWKPYLFNIGRDKDGTWFANRNGSIFIHGDSFSEIEQHAVAIIRSRMRSRKKIKGLIPKLDRTTLGDFLNWDVLGPMVVKAHIEAAKLEGFLYGKVAGRAALSRVRKRFPLQ